MKTLSEQLLQLYNALNKLYFKGILPPVIIEISFAEKQTNWSTRLYNNRQYGISVNWYSLEDEDNLYIDMLHQMIHISNSINDVIDTSGRGRYHNIKWKNEAKRVGLIVENNNRQGYYAVGINKLTILEIRQVFDYKKYENVLDEFGCTESMKINNKNKVNQLVMFKCPQCGRIAKTRATNRINCGFCLCEYIRFN